MSQFSSCSTFSPTNNDSSIAFVVDEQRSCVVVDGNSDNPSSISNSVVVSNKRSAPVNGKNNHLSPAGLKRVRLDECKADNSTMMGESGISVNRNFSPNGVNNKLPQMSNAKPGATKKLLIKNFGTSNPFFAINRDLTFKSHVFCFADKPQLPENYHTTTWDKLKEAVIAIQKSQPVSTSLEELYQAVENLCSCKMAPKLYSGLEELIDAHVRSCIKRFLDSDMDHLTFLKTMDNCWGDHCRQMVVCFFISLLFTCSFANLAHFRTSLADNDTGNIFVSRSNLRSTDGPNRFDMVRLLS